MVFRSGRRLRTIAKTIGGKKQDVMALEQPDPQALLASANSASERLSGQHITFMAVCVYVLVIVFGTTDLDLLVGKGVKLPVVNVDVPIIGFYAFAPYLVVLAHFNLLLQLQLLSRKLFDFDAAVPQDEKFGGLRDRLHIFPYTFYLVGRPPVLVRQLLGLMVSITLLLLPFITLIVLQFWFLAYQSETVTWWQRIAIWCDIIMVAILWPIILNKQDDWQAYWRGILTVHIPRRRVWAAFVLLLLGQMLFSFSATRHDIFLLVEQPFLQDSEIFLFSEIGPFIAGCVLLLLSPPVLVLLCGWSNIPPKRKTCFTALFLLVIGALGASIAFKKNELFMVAVFAVPWLFIPLAMFWHPGSPRGSLALLLMIYIGPLLPLTLHIDGEHIERILLHVQGRPDGSIVLSRFLEERRRLDLTEQVLLAKPERWPRKFGQAVKCEICYH